MPWLELVRGLVRPIVTFLLTLIIVWLSYRGKIEAKELVALYGPILGFWFGQRVRQDDRNSGGTT